MSALATMEKLSEAVDLSNHLSVIGRAREASPLKELFQYANRPGMISFAGGLPSPDYFPFDSISAEILPFNAFPSTNANIQQKQSSPFSWLWKLFSTKSADQSLNIKIPRYTEQPQAINLATALQYGRAGGLPQLQQFIQEFTLRVYRPAYSNPATLVHVGNTDGWVKAVMTLCNPGEGVLTCEWTYPSAVTAMQPLGLRAIPISIDSQGMRADSLRKVLVDWDESSSGTPRPHVMYTVPIGQNPTGAAMGQTRKKEIYDICVEFDIIIVEDDPYYFLQEGVYTPPTQRSTISKATPVVDDDDHYISQLVPSYLRFDYQGRVIRLDTFSKTIAPGCRMGWFTCNPLFAERLERQEETSTQGPCGFAQSIVTSLLLEWGISGYLRWLKGLRAQYAQRRDFFVDCMFNEFHIESLVQGGQEIFFASKKKAALSLAKNREKPASDTKTLFSFVPPSAGMFVWVKIHFQNHPSFPSLSSKDLERELWISIIEAGVLFCPGSMFAAVAHSEDAQSPGHFRISFSDQQHDMMKKAVTIFARVLTNFFREDAK